MKTLTVEQSEKSCDCAVTLRNRARLSANENLLFWYRELYRDQFRGFSDPTALSVLEIGSGTSPLKQFLPKVITSDVLSLDYLDLVFDCHEIDKVGAIGDESLDIITLTNVLHHLKSPVAFLNRAANKLKPGGKVIATEPFFSSLSTPIFKYLHHERVDFEISQPELQNITGPLASANIALPWLIFFRRREWIERLGDAFDVGNCSVRFFSAVSYMATGGISRKMPIPGWLYRRIFPLDLFFSRRFPQLCASFFTIVLSRR